MRAVRFEDKAVKVVEAPAPAGPGVRVRVRGCGICGSDIAMLDAGFPMAGIPGHELAGELPFGRGRHAGDDLVLEREHALRASVELPARFRGLDPTPGPVEQLRPEALLERAHLERDRGLRDAQPLGGLGEAPALHDRTERGELARVHK